jgi:NADH-quinone oxidoreductase subunit C
MSAAAQTLDALRARFPSLSLRPGDPAPSLPVEPGRLHDTLFLLRDTFFFDYLVFVTALDWPAEQQLEVVYRLFSYESQAAVVVRARLPRKGAHVPTASDLYPTADWHERETAELFGIVFDGHPDPRKLLLPDDLEGHPLLKDFTHPNLIRLPEVT